MRSDLPPAAEPARGQGVKLALSWLFVGIPLLWGVVTTLGNAMLLFRH
jgi:hypothetical protein